MVVDSIPRAGAEQGRVLRAARGLGNAAAGRLSRPSGVILAAAWYGLICVLSSHRVIGRPGRVAGSWLLNTGHALLFGLLAFWILLALPRREGWPVLGRSNAALVLGIALILAAVDELHQSVVPGRAMSAADVLTDVTGAACVLWICGFAGRLGATERGLRLRLLLCLAACAAAGGLATFSDGYFG